MSNQTEAKSFTHMQAEIHEVNVTNGWYDGEPRPFGDDISLLHTEVSEMYEAYRVGGLEDQTQPRPTHLIGTTDDYLPKPEGVGSEAADVLIRLLDTCDHTQRPSVGGIGCGQCWELVVRADASQTLRPKAVAS